MMMMIMNVWSGGYVGTISELVVCVQYDRQCIIESGTHAKRLAE
jgi:hypothetical protein